MAKTLIGYYRQENNGRIWKQWSDGTLESRMFSIWHGKKLPCWAKVGEIHGLIPISAEEVDF